ncbi:uncharacterized protein [Nicotiana tomentosiformis]|uniref:uncharacterized protein n=1 Tax=Nicotiana tomentosiformis TaxID=4098 RepID=UPI00388CBD6F
MDFARLAVILLPIERERVRRFIDGLNFGIRLQMSKETGDDFSFQREVEIARRIEMIRGYYRRFMEEVSSISAPLTKLTQKGALFRWSSECELSFQKLKTALSTTLVLVLPTSSRSYILYCDASRIRLGAVLMQNERPLAMDVQALANQFVRLDVSEPSRVIACIVAQSSLLKCINARQFDDPYLLVLKDTVQQGGAKEVVIGDDGVMRLQGQICVPNIDGLSDLILEKANNSCFSIHPRVKYEHQNSGGLTQRLEILEWK